MVQVIMRVGAGGDLSQLELAQELELEPAALSRLLADLEEQRLVTRRRDPEDKRRVLMAATPAGAALLTRAQPRVMAGLHALFARLSGREEEQLCRLLEKVVSEEDGAPGLSGDSRRLLARRSHAPGLPGHHERHGRREATEQLEGQRQTETAHHRARDDSRKRERRVGGDVES
jgi:DNA-binding MarR family transcriptional regulator